MSDQNDRRLSVEDAARLIYSTPEPTPVQLNKTRFRLKRGVLKGNPRHDWISERSVAEFIAARAEHQRLGKQATGAAATERLQAGAARQLSSTYQLGLADYLTAVLRYRRPQGVSPAFARSVLIGQIVLAVLPLSIAFYTIFLTGGQPPEQRQVQRWIEKNAQDPVILQWFPPVPAPDGSGKLIRVKFRYRTGKMKTIQTDRTYRVQGDSVQEYTSPED